jgi:hypothetical protein
MIEILAQVVSFVCGLGGLACFIIVLIHLFQSEQTGLGIACIVLTFICGIGPLIAFVKGWLDELGTVMWVWTGLMLTGAAAAAVLTVS